MSNESQDRVQEQAREAIRGSQGQHRGRQFALWMGALIIGAILGWLGIPALNQLLISLQQFSRAYSSSLPYRLSP